LVVAYREIDAVEEATRVQPDFDNVSIQDVDAPYSATGYSATIVIIIVAITNHLLAICTISCEQIIPRKTVVG
jgi:hypothetical protein